MGALSPTQGEFIRRLELIPAHGLGLSVDVYSPDVNSLLRALRQRQVRPAYLEVFRAAPAALVSIMKEVGEGLLTYHGEGLWLTQPDAADDALFMREVREVAGHLRTLKSAWLNHECATKHMAGYSFGTYLPPLFTESSAGVMAENARLVQATLDRHCRLANGNSPLLLLEMPPLTYFVAGTSTIPEFFRVVTGQSPCGLVLDVGHLWTVFRYSGAWRTRSLVQFVDTFLAEFPMDRVVEIHVAGLAIHESSLRTRSEPTSRRRDDILPAWTDAHEAPIPSILFEMLDQILGHPRLTSLRGLALEVDTKAEELIVDEFTWFSERYAKACPGMKSETTPLNDSEAFPFQGEPLPTSIKKALGEAYDHYARVVVGHVEPEGPEWNGPTACTDDLETYRSVYLPHEILHWGGDVAAMFPESCRRLSERGVALLRFVPFWFRWPQKPSGSYDFFLLKIERFLEFVHEEAPECDCIAAQEAAELRQGYHDANQRAVPASVIST